MQEYELWLDESGSFENDKENSKRKNFKPSLIGGILFKKGLINKEIDKILSEEYWHSTESNAEEVYNKFCQIVKLGVNLIEISNDECISVIDSNLTYQNMMAEGLTQLIKKLKLETTEDIKVNMLIAERGDCTNENKTDGKVPKVPAENYDQRLRERLILEGYRKSIPADSWSITIKNAKKEKKLMLADIVCNSFLTRDTKFKGERGDYINKIHDDEKITWLFSAFESSLDSQIQSCLIENRLGEAVLQLCQSDNKEFIQRKMKSINSYMKNMDYNELYLQFKLISIKITYYINSVRNYYICINLLNNLIDYWVDSVSNLGQSWSQSLSKEILADFLFQLDTVYTHTGNIKSSIEAEEKCDEIISNRKLSWENLTYQMKYANRKIITKINQFDFTGALNDCKSLVDKCHGIKEALGLVDENGESGSFEELGKAYGTLAQIYSFLLRSDLKYFDEAVKASDGAIAEFETQQDKKRQYGYRSHIEMEKGNFEEALKYLCMANDVSDNDINSLVNNIEGKPFSIMYYVRLMAEGCLAGWNKSQDMYRKINSRNILEDIKKNVVEKSQTYHPVEIILWKLATYRANQNELKAAFDNYELAISCCKNENELTVNFIGLAIGLERYAYALKYNTSDKKKCLKDSIRYHKDLMDKNLPESMTAIYGDLSFEADDWNYYFEMSRRITY